MRRQTSTYKINVYLPQVHIVIDKVIKIKHRVNNQGSNSYMYMLMKMCVYSLFYGCGSVNTKQQSKIIGLYID